MKKILIAALGLAATVQFSAADVTSKLIGTWSGNSTSTVKGKVVQQRGTVVYKRYEGTGLIAKTTITTQGLKAVGITRYRRDGSVEGEMKVNGTVAAFVTGKWSATNTTLSSTVKAEGIVAPFRTTSKLTLLSKKQFKVVGSTSTGERTAGSFKKR